MGVWALRAGYILPLLHLYVFSTKQSNSQKHSYKSFTLPLDPATPDATLQALPGLFQKLLEGTYSCT